MLFSQIFERPDSEINPLYLSNILNDHRKIINLNGTWKFSAVNGEFSGPVKVPSCYDFRGKAIYSRQFSVDVLELRSWNYILVCEGINYQCDISINGSFMIKHEGGFTKFTSVIPNDLIKESGNQIEITVDNKLDKSRTIPLRNLILSPKNYGGIFRDIYILAVPKVFIKSINVSTEIDISYNSDIKNIITITSSDINFIDLPADREVFVQTEILDSGGIVKASSSPMPITINSNSTIEAANNFSFPDAQYWSPENPYLYKLRVRIITGDQLVIDEYSEDLGIYEIAQKPYSYTLNTAPFKIKGIGYVEEMMGYGIAMKYEDLENDIKNIKSLGFNSIRVYGRAASPYLISLCNRYGLFIMMDIPVIAIPNSVINTEGFIAVAENQLSEMILSSKNNPSIFAYGIGSYLDFSEQNTKNYIQRLSSHAKKLDNRFVFYSSRSLNNDICRDLVDMVGLVLMEEDSKWLKDYLSDPKTKKDKIFISGYGRTIDPSNTNGYSDPSSLESQSKLISDVTRILKNSPMLGSVFMTYSDWQSDFPGSGTYLQNSYIRTTGLYSSAREQRPPGIIMRKVNYDEDLPNFNIGTYTKESPIVFIFTGIGLFLVFVYLANNIRRFRENIWRALFRPFIFFTDVREQNLIPGWYNILLAAILAIGNSLFFSSLIYFWKDNPDFDIIASAMLSSELLKTWFNYALIDPVKLTALIAFIIFIIFFIAAIIIWLYSLTLRFRVPFNNIYTVAVWSFLPTLVLLIIGVFYFRVITENTDFITFGLVIAAAIIIISLYRIIKGAYLIFDSPIFKTYFYGILTIAIVLGGLWFYLNTTKFMMDYLDLVFSFLKT